jgi:hypothetical protein
VLLTRIVPVTVPPVIEHAMGMDTMKYGLLLVNVQPVSRRLNPVPLTLTEEPRGPWSGDRTTTRGTMFNVAEAELGAGGVVPVPVTVIV